MTFLEASRAGETILRQRMKNDPQEYAGWNDGELTEEAERLGKIEARRMMETAEAESLRRGDGEYF